MSAFEHRADAVGHVVVHPVGIDDPLALAEDDVALHVELQRHALVLRRSGRSRSGSVRAGGPDHQPIGRDVDRADLAAAGPSTITFTPESITAIHWLPRRIGKPLGLHGHVAAREDADSPCPAGRRGRRHARRQIRRRRGCRRCARRCRSGQGAGRSGTSRSGCGVLCLPDAAPPLPVRRRPASDAPCPPVDRRQNVRLPGDCGGLHPNAADRKEPAEPTGVGHPRAPGRRSSAISTSPSRYAIILLGRCSVGSARSIQSTASRLRA